MLPIDEFITTAMGTLLIKFVPSAEPNVPNCSGLPSAQRSFIWPQAFLYFCLERSSKLFAAKREIAIEIRVETIRPENSRSTREYSRMRLRVSPDSVNAGRLLPQISAGIRKEQIRSGALRLHGCHFACRRFDGTLHFMCRTLKF